MVFHDDFYVRVLQDLGVSKEQIILLSNLELLKDLTHLRIIDYSASFPPSAGEVDADSLYMGALITESLQDHDIFVNYLKQAGLGKKINRPNSVLSVNREGLSWHHVKFSGKDDSTTYLTALPKEFPTMKSIYDIRNSIPLYPDAIRYYHRLLNNPKRTPISLGDLQGK